MNRILLYVIIYFINYNICFASNWQQIGSFIKFTSDAGAWGYIGDFAALKKYNTTTGLYSDTASEYQHFIIYGQSLAVGQQTYPALSVNNVVGNYMIGNRVWINYGNSNFTTLNPLIATQIGTTNKSGATAECPLVGTVNHIQRKLNNGTQIIATSCAYSGKTIEQLSKECNTTTPSYYSNFSNAITYALKIAEKTTSKITCPAIIWMQGEYNYFAKTTSGLIEKQANCTDKVTYKNLLLKLKNNMQADVMNSYSQENKPLFITYQVGAQYTKGKDVAIGMAQLEAANENEDIICAGPVYPVTDRGGHLDGNGSRWYGEMIGKAYYKSKILGIDFKPLQPKEISRTTNAKQIKIQFLVPKLPLILDTLIVDKVPDYGFAVYNDNIKMTIASIAIDGDCIYLTCTENLTGVVEVTYAGPNSGILNGHGNLRDSDDYKSFYNYIDLDKRNPDGTFFYPHDLTDVTLRPTFEPKDAEGVIYDKPYPLYNFSVAFYYKLNAEQQTYIVPNLVNAPTRTNSAVIKPILKIYQSGSSLIVDADNDKITQFELFNLSGNLIRKLSTSFLNSGVSNYSISSVPKGVYLAKITTSKTTDSIKVTIQ